MITRHFSVGPVCSLIFPHFGQCWDSEMVAIKFVNTSKICTLSNQNLYTEVIKFPFLCLKRPRCWGLRMNLRFFITGYTVLCCAVLTCCLHPSASMIGAGVCADTTICMTMPSRSP